MWYHECMSTDTNVLNKNPVSVGQTVPLQPQAAVQPVVPAGSINKETGPVSVSGSEFIKPTEAEPQVSQELKESGVEVKSDRPDLTFEHKELGIDHAGPHAPVPSSPTGKIVMPMSEEEVAEKIKTGQNDDSGKWLAGLLQKIIKVIGL